MIKKLLAYVFLVFLVFTNPSWSVSCDGWDSDTGAWVWGDCQPGGSLDGWNSETGSWVWGDCDS